MKISIFHNYIKYLLSCVTNKITYLQTKHLLPLTSSLLFWSNIHHSQPQKSFKKFITPTPKKSSKTLHLLDWILRLQPIVCQFWVREQSLQKFFLKWKERLQIGRQKNNWVLVEWRKGTGYEIRKTIMDYGSSLKGKLLEKNQLTVTVELPSCVWVLRASFPALDRSAAFAGLVGVCWERKTVWTEWPFVAKKFWS